MHKLTVDSNFRFVGGELDKKIYTAQTFSKLYTKNFDKAIESKQNSD